MLINGNMDSQKTPDLRRETNKENENWVTGKAKNHHHQ
jgi:hypothetical protein